MEFAIKYPLIPLVCYGNIYEIPLVNMNYQNDLVLYELLLNKSIPLNMNTHRH
ncbi:MAG: hypothetical protein PARBA_01395 [Parabacteroides sp.]